MELEVGEWVKLKDGRIRIFKGYLSEEDIELTRSYNIAKIKDIVKHSKNIIDLIEEGDYVNGLVVYKGKVANGKEKLLIGNHIIKGMALELVNIKSIVTKESFASVEYKVEEAKDANKM